MTVRVATYTRISTDEENQPFSLESQEQRLGAFIQSQDGWELARQFTDRMSGSTLDRPDLQRALSEARMNRYDLLLVYRLDRLTRSVRGLAQVLEDLDRCKVAFRSATEPFDTATPAGRMMVQMLGVFAEFERATIIDRVVAGMERKAARGGWLGTPVPFGYRHGSGEDRGLVPDENQAPVVALIFDLYTRRHLSSKAIAEWLNEQGYRTRRGRIWSFDSVLTVLHNEAYRGKVLFRGVYHPGVHPPLVDAATFEKARALLNARAKDHARRAGDPSSYLLSGLVTCGGCGRRLIGQIAHGRRARYRYYVCGSRAKFGRDSTCGAERLNAEDLEAAVIDALRSTYAEADLLVDAVTVALERANADQPKVAEQMAGVEAEIRRTQESIDRYFAAFESGAMPESLCAPRVTSLQERLPSDAVRIHEAMVEPSGIEPLTSCMPCKRSPS